MSNQPLNLLLIVQPDVAWLPQIVDRLGDGVEVTIAGTEDTVIAAAKDADVILNAGFQPPLVAAAVASAGKVRWFHSLWTGVESILGPEMQASSVVLTNGRGAFARSLGEWTVGAMLFFAYRMRRMVRQQMESVWQDFSTEELHGKTLGIVGYGEIGKAAAERAKAFGMRILALRRRPELFHGDGIVDQTYRLDQLNNLIGSSDYVLAAAPLTDQTRGMIGVEQIAAMKPTAVLINVGRGAVVEEDALIDALQENRIRGAALDVFTQEPLPAGHPFWTMENVLVSPHTADRVEDFVSPAVDVFLENLQRFRAGEELKFVVDKRAGY